MVIEPQQTRSSTPLCVKQCTVFSGLLVLVSKLLLRLNKQRKNQ